MRGVTPTLAQQGSGDRGSKQGLRRWLRPKVHCSCRQLGVDIELRFACAGDAGQGATAHSSAHHRAIIAAGTICHRRGGVLVEHSAAAMPCMLDIVTRGFALRSARQIGCAPRRKQQCRRQHVDHLSAERAAEWIHRMEPSLALRHTFGHSNSNQSSRQDARGTL
jgi:hypothetical protein